MGLSMLLGLCIWGLESRAREGLREAEHIQAPDRRSLLSRRVRRWPSR